MSSGIKTVAIGLSGGVDSSVAAALLIEQGYAVTGLMLRLWVDEETEEANRCCSTDSISLARKVARELDIPFYVIDARQEFRKFVVEYFLDSYRAGETPNPCVVCNKWIRWGFLRKNADNMGLEYLATGHYARIERRENSFHLMRGADKNKDQSYVLSRLNQNDLARTILPLGSWEKSETRIKAASIGLPVSQKPDSQDLCFSGKGVSGFLQKFSPDLFKPGEIVDEGGQPIGRHDGLANFTIGQRKGIKIASERPFYVVRKDHQKNQLVVSGVDVSGRTRFRVRDLNWINPQQSEEILAEVMVRYRSISYPARININNEPGCATVETSIPINNVTPGQLAVIYKGDDVVGSGFITKDM